MSKALQYVNVLLLGAFLSANVFAQSSETLTEVTSEFLIERALATSEKGDFVSLASFLGVSVAGCLSSGQGEFECQAIVRGGSGQYNYWWMWDGPGHLYQTNTDYVSINDCLDGEGSLTVQVLDRHTNQVSRSAPYPVMCDCSPGNDACDIDIFYDDPCWPGLGFCI